MREAPSVVTGHRTLIVDDDVLALKYFKRVLEGAGFTVDTAGNGREALERFRERHYDAILSDIIMPEMDGMRFLQEVRREDVDVPFVLLTGDPSLATATAAVEYGALRYLIKPLDAEVLQQTMQRAVQLHDLARRKRQALSLLNAPEIEVVGRGPTALEVSFPRALERLWLAYQPVVHLSRKRLFGFEALVRSDEPTLANPGALFDAAEKLGQLSQIGRAIRARAADIVGSLPGGASILVNLHPEDLGDDELYSHQSPLSRVAERVVLEITERAALDGLSDVRDRIAKLRRLGYRVAVDDLGAGYAGLSTFALLEPDIVKIDMSLVRNVNSDVTKQSVIRSIISLCRELRIQIVLEGIETPAETATLVGLGGELFQGFFFAKPARTLAEPSQIFRN